MGQVKQIDSDAITTYLVNLINQNNDTLRGRWVDYDQEPGDPKGARYRVYRDLQDQLPYIPAIEVVEKGTTTNIYSIGTQEDQFEYDIIVTVNNNHAEHSKSYLRIMAKAIMDLLNAFENRKFEVPGHDFCAYYSEASRVEYGFRRGKGLKSARISWMAKLLKPNRI